MKSLRLLSIKGIILTLLFYLSLLYENTQGERLYILIGIFALFLLIGILRIRYIHIPIVKYTFLLDIALVFFMEYNSRYLINYFFHSFYILILLEASLTLNRNKSLVIGLATVAASLIKYVLLIYYKSNLGNLSEIIFFIILNALILIIVNFAQYHKEEKEKKDILYKELLNTHKKLKEYTDRIEELTIIEERNRIARDIHDTLGHNMTALIMQIEMAEHLMDENIDYSKKLLEEAKTTAREGLTNIREVVETLNKDNIKLKGIESIRNLIKEFAHKTNIDISFDVEGDIITTDPIVDSSLYRIIQEALTNGVRHGKATEIHVSLKYIEGGVNFIIKNNGICESDFKEGYGIKGMKNRIKDLRGTISFDTTDGFKVSGFIPMEVK